MDAMIFTTAVSILLLLAALALRFGVDSRPSYADGQRNWW